jgi:hypothetical protein
VSSASVLSEAARLIRDEGWIQFHSESNWVSADTLGHVFHARCALKAIQDAVGRRDDSCPGDDFARVVWCFAEAHGGLSPVAFNDEAGRTAAEVVAALLKAADLAEARART